MSDDDHNDETFGATFHVLDSEQLAAETQHMASLAEQHEAFLKAHGLRGSISNGGSSMNSSSSNSGSGLMNATVESNQSDDEFDIDLQMSSVLKALEIDDDDSRQLKMFNGSTSSSGFSSASSGRRMMTVADLEAKLKPNHAAITQLQVKQQQPQQLQPHQAQPSQQHHQQRRSSLSQQSPAPQPLHIQQMYSQQQSPPHQLIFQNNSSQLNSQHSSQITPQQSPQHSPQQSSQQSPQSSQQSPHQSPQRNSFSNMPQQQQLPQRFEHFSRSPQSNVFSQNHHGNAQEIRSTAQLSNFPQSIVGLQSTHQPSPSFQPSRQNPLPGLPSQSVNQVHNFHLRQQHQQHQQQQYQHQPHRQHQQFPQQQQQSQQFSQQSRPLHILRPDVRPNATQHQNIQTQLQQQQRHQLQQQQQQRQQPSPTSADVQSLSSFSHHDPTQTHIPLPAGRFECMQKSEIAQIIRVQLSQLQNGGVESSLPMIFKPKVNPFRNPDGSPILQEGTLGRIVVPNLRKPKKLLALGGSCEKKEINLDEDPGPPRQLMFGNFSLAFLIEEGHRCAMDLEECDSLIASLSPQRFEDPNQTFQRAQLVQERSHLVAQLAEALDLEDGPSSDYLVLKFLSTSTGRHLVYRSLVVLSPPHTLQLAYVLLYDIKVLLDYPQSTIARDYKFGQLIAAAVLEMPAQQLNSCFQLLVTRNDSATMVRILRSSVGAAVFLSIFKSVHVNSIHDEMWEAALTSFLTLLQDHFTLLFEPNFSDQKEIIEGAMASREILWEVVAAIVFHASSYRSQLEELIPLVTRGLTEMQPTTAALNFLASFFDLVP